MGAIWACLLAKMASEGGPILEVENNTIECCNCDENSTDSPQQATAAPLEKETTDITRIPDDFLSPRTIPPKELFESSGSGHLMGNSPEVTVVNINV